MIAIGYARVSTDKQGISVEAQTAKIRAIVTTKDGWTLQEVIEDDGESAKSLERPGMQRLLQLIDEGAIQVVVIAKLDRLTRSIRDLGTLLDRLETHRIALVSVAESLDTASAAGRLVINIMMSVSQWEREAISERTKDILAHKKKKGERVGTVPYGFRLKTDGLAKEKNGKTVLMQIEPEPQEQATIVEIHRLRKRGRGWTTRAIAEELNRKGLKMRGSREWTFGRVAQILKNPRIID